MCCTCSSLLSARQREIERKTKELLNVDDVMDSMSVQTILQANCISIISDEWTHLCWVGLVFCSWLSPIIGTMDTWTKQKFSFFTSN